MVRGELMMPVHWGLWNLAMHGWTEPVERVLVEAEVQDVQVFVPRPGQSFEPGDLPAQEQWWPDLPWQTAAEAPIVVSAGTWLNAPQTAPATTPAPDPAPAAPHPAPAGR